ncbi:hypothetical protein GCM10010978_16020 [Compostibacillus humi]|uniref:DnaJ homologue subfamily C member 28 conserved domain-containing protein n=1 Tax=Compostibacillus humi TaxID=1245525 RepID=A0A8J3EK04_9BACI|nr:DUF1992 domain-containing protein [Compostibacillus humi]GGH75799.1 hypothetical protein GCM10010978_16020 [Compostibacillus humi]HLT56540.1 DUF1992 domain-containing protein [Bacillota bacterium]
MYFIVEEKIKEAIENGEFDNLPGMGKPLNLREELQGLSPEVRRAYKILKHAGYIPDDAKKEEIKMKDLLNYATDGKITEDPTIKEEYLRFVKDRKLNHRSVFAKYTKKLYKKFT